MYQGSRFHIASTVTALVISASEDLSQNQPQIQRSLPQMHLRRKLIAPIPLRKKDSVSYATLASYTSIIHGEVSKTYHQLPCFLPPFFARCSPIHDALSRGTSNDVRTSVRYAPSQFSCT